jgi:hypothetical protein
MATKKPAHPTEEAPQDVIATPETPAVVSCPVCGNPARVGSTCAVDGTLVATAPALS